VLQLGWAGLYQEGNAGPVGAVTGADCEQIIDHEGKVQYYIRDFARAATESRIDVYPGEEELLRRCRLV
jgi:hypothetical protein